MSSVSAVVDRAAAAVEQADAVPPSDEVRAEESGGSGPEQRAKTDAALKKGGVKPLTKAQKEQARLDALNDGSRGQGKGVAEAAKPTAKPSPKYGPELKAAAKRAEQLRGKARSVGPVQIERAQAALAKVKTDPAAIVKAFKSRKAATEFAGGAKDVEQPTAVKDIGAIIDDPFARGRGLTAICLALTEK